MSCPSSTIRSGYSTFNAVFSETGTDSMHRDADLSHSKHMRCRPMPVVPFVTHEIMCCKPSSMPCG